MTAGSSRRTAAAGVPLLLVNTWAVYGQAGWAVDHLALVMVAAVAFALTVESIALYLAYEAHAALLAGDSSMRLRAASYLVAGGVGGMNYTHYAGPHWQPTAAALTFGALSALSPWLWAIRSRSQRREQLRALGLVDSRAAHFTAGRWVHFPGSTLRALRWSIDHGTPDPAEAWSAVRGVTAPALDDAAAGPLDNLRAELDEVRRVALDNAAGPTLDSLRSGLLDEVRKLALSNPRQRPVSKRPAKPAVQRQQRSPEYSEAVRRMVAAGVSRSTASHRAGRAEGQGTLPTLLAEYPPVRVVATGPDSPAPREAGLP